MHTGKLRVVSSRSLRFVAGLFLLGAFAVTGARDVQAADGPLIVKPRLIMTVWQTWHNWIPTTKKFQANTTSWMPDLKFLVRGPVPTGSQFSVDFTKPTGAPIWHINCQTDEIKEGDTETVETPRLTSTEDEKKYTTGLGVFGFRIRIKNEMSGQNQVLYSGKFKVSKVSKFNGTPITKNKCDYYVDQDWMLPVGYLYSKPDTVSPPLAASMWFKGDTNGGDLSAYLFYNGKQIASTNKGGSASLTEEELNTFDNDKGDPTWQLWVLQWDRVAMAPNEGDTPEDTIFYLNKNPGSYEIKVVRKGELSRQAKFSVGADGEVVDNGLVTANKLNTERFVLPVKVLGTTDGTWQKTAWQTQAFYGNPMKGFVIP